jgi:hypothetical protein
LIVIPNKPGGDRGLGEDNVRTLSANFIVTELLGSGNQNSLAFGCVYDR